MKLAWIQIIIALVIGLVLGFGFSTLKCRMCCGHCWKKFAHHEKIADKLARKLDLNNDQKALVQAAVNRKHERMKEIMKQAKEEIKTVLNPEQSKKFDELTEKCKGFN